MTKQEIIAQIGYLFWWVKDKQNLTDDAIVETVLCFGDEKEVKSLFDWLGVENVAEIFKRQILQKRVNYPTRTQHYFTLFFDKYVS